MTTSQVVLPANNWVPRPYQRRAWRYLENGGTRALLIWHRRAGKDEVALNWTAVASQMRVGNYWHMLPQASQARKSMWDAMNPHTGRRRIDDVFPFDMRANTRDSDMFIRFKNGSTWQLVGSDNFDHLVGSSPIGLVFSEWPLSDPRAWAMLRPILLENGGWAIFPYTPRGKNHGWSLKESASVDDSWLVDIKTVDQTHLFDQRQLATELREYIRENGPDDGQAMFDQEYHVSFNAAIRGAYYAKWIEKAEEEGRLTKVPYDGNSLVTTAWDIGIGDPVAIWFLQPVGRELRVIDYYENNGQGIDHYAGIIHGKPYIYQEHILPHDAGARELGTGKSIEAMLRKMDLKVRIAPKVSIQSGIHNVRALLSRMVFDREKCSRGLDALRHYHAEYNEKLKVVLDEPCHDWSSHAADAIRMLAVAWRDKMKGREREYEPLEWL